jgi:two-component system, OmpR family, sensor histidine kinase SenX3
MRITSRRGTIVFFLCLGIGLVALAVALNVGWIILNWREGVLLFFGIIFFALIIAGMVVNTIFLVREIRRSEQHDSFINAVTHELKTPVASIRLHLGTKRRDGPRRKSIFVNWCASAWTPPGRTITCKPRRFNTRRLPLTVTV